MTLPILHESEIEQLLDHQMIESFNPAEIISPLPILLVAPISHKTDFARYLEGTSVTVVGAFNSNALHGHRFEAVLVCSEHAQAETDRRRLVDWINTTVMRYVPSGRKPLWI